VNDEPVGGLYGVALGRMFYGESMFHRKTDASKIAFVHLVRQLQQQGYGMIDCQMKTAHLERFGARAIMRNEFVENLAELVNYPQTPGPWRYDITD
jgi:leucyl/phenylalanyl-tRNA--protein transferase